ncbi:hypothetical protein ACVIIV_003765 [Bradyrhizobium sp. USDA 4354]
MSILFDHHIILKRFRDHDAFLGIDKEIFDIDSPANRIYLPADPKIAARLGVSPHPSNHIDSYAGTVKTKLDRIKETESPSERAAEIRTLIDAMRVGFLNGHLYANWPIDKTREEVERLHAKIFDDPKAYLAQYPDQLRIIRDIEQRGANAGLDHLIKWLLYLDNPERRKILDEVIASNPGVNLTSGNSNLAGTDWSKFEASDPSSGILRIPGSTPVNPSDFPPLPGYSSPSLAGLNDNEGFTRSDPRFTGALPPFATPSPNEQRLGQLPPTTAAPTDPLVLKSDPITGTMNPYYENPLAGGTSPERDVLPWLAGGVAVGLAAPSILPWLLGVGGILAFTRAANAQESSSGATMEAATPGGGVFSTGAPPHNTLNNGLSVDNAAGTRGVLRSSTLRPQLDGASSFDPEAPASTFADRFGDWVTTRADTMPAKDLPVAPTSAAGSFAPEDVRRLARVNETNAGNVFTSGSAPVPYLPSTEFDERFGTWTVLAARGQQPQPSKPIGVFADEPSYLIPPPIFGVDGLVNPHSDSEEWFSRWIRPLLRPE